MFAQRGRHIEYEGREEGGPVWESQRRRAQPVAGEKLSMRQAAAAAALLGSAFGIPTTYYAKTLLSLSTFAPAGACGQLTKTKTKHSEYSHMKVFLSLSVI